MPRKAGSAREVLSGRQIRRSFSRAMPAPPPPRTSMRRPPKADCSRGAQCPWRATAISCLRCEGRKNSSSGIGHPGHPPYQIVIRDPAAVHVVVPASENTGSGTLLPIEHLLDHVLEVCGALRFRARVVDVAEVDQDVRILRFDMVLRAMSAPVPQSPKRAILAPLLIVMGETRSEALM